MKGLSIIFLFGLLVASCNNDKPSVVVNINLIGETSDSIQKLVNEAANNDSVRVININIYNTTTNQTKEETPKSKEEVKQEEKPIVAQQVTPKKEEEKINYEDHYILDLSKAPEQAKIDKVDKLALDAAKFTEALRKAINSPEKYSDVLPYLMQKICTVSKDEIIDTFIESPNYKFYFDRKNKKIVKARKRSNDLAVHQNVDTPKENTKSEETK